MIHQEVIGLEIICWETSFDNSQLCFLQQTEENPTGQHEDLVSSKMFPEIYQQHPYRCFMLLHVRCFHETPMKSPFQAY